MKAILCGANGAMGKRISALLGEEIIGRVSLDGENETPRTFSELGLMECDVLLDFSHHTAVTDVLDYAKKVGCAVVIGATGHTTEEKALIRDTARLIPVFYGGNVSLGIAVLCRLVKQAAAFFPDADIEILETLNSQQTDAPGATAMMLYNVIKEVRPQAWPNSGRSGEIKRTPEEVGIHSLRMGSLAGIHEVHIHAGSQCLTLKHEATSPDSLAEGAAAAARFMLGKGRGLYDMESLLNEKK